MPDIDEVLRDAYRDTELDKTFNQIIANPNLFRGRGVALCGRLELMAEATDLFLQDSRGGSLPGRLSHGGRNIG